MLFPYKAMAILPEHKPAKGWKLALRHCGKGATMLSVCGHRHIWPESQLPFSFLYRIAFASFP
jgi:hypothetical protein